MRPASIFLIIQLSNSRAENILLSFLFFGEVKYCKKSKYAVKSCL